MAAVSFSCPSCGGPMTLYAQGQSETVVCPSCGSVLDAQDPKHAVLSRYRARVNQDPTLPIGKRGKIRGEDFQILGYMARKVRYWGVDYRWGEYLLWNPFKGFRWLLESDGHWTFMTPVTDPPQEPGKRKVKAGSS